MSLSEDRWMSQVFTRVHEARQVPFSPEDLWAWVKLMKPKEEFERTPQSAQLAAADYVVRVVYRRVSDRHEVMRDV